MRSRHVNELLELKNWFAAGLISDAGPQAFLDQLATSGPVSPDEALSIYRSSSRAACINALKQVYPVCHALLGERSFRALSRDYLTLYQTRYYPERMGWVPDLEKGEVPMELVSRGVRVQLWREQGLLFVLAGAE